MLIKFDLNQKPFNLVDIFKTSRSKSGNYTVEYHLTDHLFDKPNTYNKTRISLEILSDIDAISCITITHYHNNGKFKNENYFTWNYDEYRYNPNHNICLANNIRCHTHGLFTLEKLQNISALDFVNEIKIMQLFS